MAMRANRCVAGLAGAGSTDFSAGRGAPMLSPSRAAKASSSSRSKANHPRTRSGVYAGRVNGVTAIQRRIVSPRSSFVLFGKRPADQLEDILGEAWRGQDALQLG